MECRFSLSFIRFPAGSRHKCFGKNNNNIQDNLSLDRAVSVRASLELDKEKPHLRQNRPIMASVACQALMDMYEHHSLQCTVQRYLNNLKNSRYTAIYKAIVYKL